MTICHEGWRYPETVRRAAENTCDFAAVNYAFARAPPCTALATPDGDLLASNPSGATGLLLADLDLTQATGLLARRCRPAFRSRWSLKHCTF